MMKKYRYKKSYRTKKKKSILKNKFFWLGVLVLIIFSGLVYLFIFSSVFEVKVIEIAGVEKVPAEEIKQIISENTKNIFLVNLTKLQENILEKYPQIAKLNLKRKLPSLLLVQVEERKPVAVLLKNDERFFIDKEGVAFEKVSSPPPDMLIIRAQEINQKQVEQVLKIDSELTIPIEEILIVSEKRINVKTLKGWEIYFNPKEDLDWQLEELNILLKEKISPEQYIDLRFNKVYLY